MGARIGKIFRALRRMEREPEVHVSESPMIIIQQQIHEYRISFGEWFVRMEEINPRFPKIFIGLAVVAFVIICVEIYVTLIEHFHGETEEYKSTRSKMREAKRATKSISLATRAKLAAKALQERELPGSKEYAEREANIDLEKFLVDLHIHGLRVKRVKGQGESASPTKKTKYLRIASDGDLFFHTEGFKLKKLVVSGDRWPISALLSCLEGDANLGEVYLEFHVPRKRNEVLRIIVIDDAERGYVIKAFNDIVQALTTHPHVIYDTCLNAEKIASQGEGGLVDINSSAVLGSTASKASMSPVTPQKMDRTPPGPGGAGDKYSPGKSPLLRSPINTPGRPGNAAQALASPSSSEPGIADGKKLSKDGPPPPRFNLNTNFHLFSNKDLVAAVKAEGLGDKARGHRERQELIKILEAHYRRVGRALAKQPIVRVKRDFEVQLREIYEEYNPDKIKDIPLIVEHFKGQEEHLLEQLHLKYDIQEHHHHLIGAEE
jgi:hypothetical protein